ncbi:UvrB/UvrC motif-containing protein [Syntrophomonas palmitatica]|uniref:UvrB/UvrC motif-containing protein n=1 Tax=Syntrophomonas palmitatica TaxID=402877 RepID=UPI0006D175E1|nr:UvrB/UvrC motif-containing protein [Syntrophomonas palmitatica]
MLCDECKQKPANVHFAQMVNGQKTETHLCEECAAKKGTFIFQIDNSFSIPNLLASFFGNYNMQGMPVLAPAKSCANCGTSLDNVKQTGKLGCSECYSVFDDELEPTLRRIHGNNQHIGKVPARGGEKVILKKRVEYLKQQLQQAILNEDYEKAAEIRDVIKDIEKKLN